MTEARREANGSGGARTSAKHEANHKFLERHPALRDYLERVATQAGFELRLVHVKAAEIIPLAEATPRGRYRRPVATVRWDCNGVVRVIREAVGQTGLDVDALAPSTEEADAIKTEIAKSVSEGDFPQSVPTASLELAPFRNDDPNDLFVCRDVSGKQILFVHQRTADGDYLPWSFWSDKVWRNMRPDGGMPLWGLDQLRDNSIVFLHEGAKAARYCRWLTTGSTIDGWMFGGTEKANAALADHPWGEYFRNAAHIGWLGGAPPTAEQVDWSPLARRKDLNIILVCDNDDQGNEAAELIARYHLPQPMEVIRFDNDFGPGFDLGDPFPPELFKQSRNGKRYYIGPRFIDCLITTTWATETVIGKGRPSFRLRREFTREWCWSIKGPTFFQIDRPGRGYSEREFNDKVRPFSDADDTARLVKRSAARQVEQEVYEPGRKPGIINIDGKRVFNSFRPPNVMLVKGDPAPWIEFSEYLIPKPADRLHVWRWCATLLTRRDVRMLYGLLLASAKQGVGKSTLARILSRLLGSWNVSSPSQDQIEGDFNGYLARVLLVVIEEIYAAQSKRLYDKMKTYMTEPDVRVNEKFQPAISLSAHAAFLATSNSRRAIWMNEYDRRWFVPEVTETLRPVSYWSAFHDWLDGDGLGIILQWARDFVAENGPVGPGDHAPRSSAKDEMIEESKSEGRRAVHDLGRLVMTRAREAEDKAFREAEALVAAATEAAAGMTAEELKLLMGAKVAAAPAPLIGHVLILEDVRYWLKSYLHMPANDLKLEANETIRRELIRAGFYAPPRGKRFDIDGRDLSALATFPLTAEMTWRDIKGLRLELKELLAIFPPRL